MVDLGMQVPQLTPIDPKVVSLANAALAAGDTAAAVVAASQPKLEGITEQSAAATQQLLETQKAAELAKQSRAASLDALSAKAQAVTGTDLKDPNNIIANLMKQHTEAVLQGVEVSNKITAIDNMSPLDNPFGWLIAQFQRDGLMQQQTNLSTKAANIQAGIKSTDDLGKEYADMLKTTIPSSTLEENNLALQTLQYNADQKGFEARTALVVNANKTAEESANILQNNFRTVLALDSDANTRIDRYNNLIVQYKQLEQSQQRFNAEAPQREMAARQLQDAKLWDSQLYKLGVAIGADKSAPPDKQREVAIAAGSRMMKLATPQEQHALLSYMDSDKISMEAANVIAGNVNPNAAPSGIAQLSADTLKARREVQAEYEKHLATLSVEQRQPKSLETLMNLPDAQRKIQQGVSNILADRAVTMTPTQLDAASIVGKKVLNEFPEMAALVGSQVPITPELELAAFAASFKDSAHAAAVRYAAYNRAKLQATISNYPLTQGDVIVPTTLTTTMKATGVFGQPTTQQVNLLDVGSIEKYYISRNSSNLLDVKERYKNISDIGGHFEFEKPKNQDITETYRNLPEVGGTVSYPGLANPQPHGESTVPGRRSIPGGSVRNY